MAVIPEDFVRLGVSLGLGLLVGLQRERVKEPIAGIRTFGLITLLGTASTMLPHWVTGVALAGVVLVVVTGSILKARTGDDDVGMTTEIAAILMFVVGVLLGTEHEVVAIVLGGTVALLLQLKVTLHTFIDRLDGRDVRAIFQFVLITLVVLPIVPDESFGPYDVLNARNIWWMVVLVVGISLGGYLVYALLGRRAGMFVGGVIGGLISSTATTVSYSKRRAPRPLPVVVVILIATSVMYARIIAELFVVAPSHAAEMAVPVGIVGGVMLGMSLLAGLAAKGVSLEMPRPENPAELKPALIFAAIYAIVLVLVAWSKEVFGQAGMYAVAALSGVADMDAITLSSGRLVEAGQMAPGTAWRAIVIGSVSNMVFKVGIAWALGGWGLAWRLAAGFAGAAAAGMVLMVVM